MKKLMLSLNDDFIKNFPEIYSKPNKVNKYLKKYSDHISHSVYINEKNSKENKEEKITFVDLGTGSGAISIALALANPNWSGIATDIDKSAIEIASRNFKTNSKSSC